LSGITRIKQLGFLDHCPCDMKQCPCDGALRNFLWLQCVSGYGPAHMTQDIYGKQFFPTHLKR